ncbi:competence pheromone ComX [Calidifontibacillus erzurumensis]|uniref:ComX pheromone n=1 Tax=Calidifontibacillus erzurumensis TaxID=2741433 RepID=A0A8J8GCM9_9BACI|nr:competence pheromone ComX [Calidifontibacillus erzurumensis]NSL51242.1 competence pheromone ComX [Calidifontibacillus erzurumensis]
MLGEIIHYLMKNQEAFEQVQNGLASIVGASEEETQIILDVINGTSKILTGYWF